MKKYNRCRCFFNDPNLTQFTPSFRKFNFGLFVSYSFLFIFVKTLISKIQNGRHFEMVQSRIFTLPITLVLNIPHACTGLEVNPLGLLRYVKLIMKKIHSDSQAEN